MPKFGVQWRWCFACFAKPAMPFKWYNGSTSGSKPKRRLAPKALLRCKRRVRELTRRTRGVSVEQMTKELAEYLARLEQLLRLLRNILRAAQVGSMDTTPVAIHDVEAMEAGDAAVRET